MDSHKHIKPIDNEPFVSPLHEALRGTTAMPIMRSTLHNQPTVHPPQKPTNISMNDKFIYPYQGMAPTSLPSLYSHTTDSSGEPIISNAFHSKHLASSSSNHHNTFMSEQDFVTRPVSDYLSSSDPMSIKSMDPPPLTCLLQGNPLANLHGHFDTIKEVDLGPVFEQPTHVQSEPLISMREVVGSYENIMQRISHYTLEYERGRLEYVCKICSAKFFSAQAFGGHMSHHSKVKKKEAKSIA
ncbi:hypothetical protein SORBI_3002G027300 [Sorghum bicolor]|uniref:C2H2-type domain-containing protein n=1 Tax=Sorghum bicolor TaxID=4558 RepID=A0A1B6Q8X4_SORBI|nr:hypothetical protein SORBI_3002G027300 [Sorghum bicolor]